MKTAYKNIETILENPFTELSLIGKEAIKSASVPYQKLPEISSQFHLVDWDNNDNQAEIHYAVKDTEIGKMFMAATSKGLCYLGFENNDLDFCIKDLQSRFPKNEIKEGESQYFQSVVDFCNGNHQTSIQLHLKGTDFQLDIWKKLLQIPEGTLTTYSALHNDIKAARAVGTAVGDNLVSYIIPCHRVVRSDGSFKGYFWGTETKRKLLAYELQKTEQ